LRGESEARERERERKREGQINRKKVRDLNSPVSGLKASASLSQSANAVGPPNCCSVASKAPAPIPCKFPLTASGKYPAKKKINGVRVRERAGERERGMEGEREGEREGEKERERKRESQYPVNFHQQPLGNKLYRKKKWNLECEDRLKIAGRL
jgi:hypothetical protein